MTESKAKKSGLEFEVPEGWKLERLDFLADIQQGVSKGKKFKKIETVFHPYLRVANVKDGYFDLSEIKEIEIPISDLDRYAVLEKDILITEGGDPDKLGRGSIWMGEVQRPVFQNHLFRIRSKKTKLEPWYLFNYLQSHKAKTYYLNAAKQTTGIASINSSQVKETPILLPPLAEQRAIAQVLGTIDQAIQTTERLIAQKELRKKWLMQQLLTGKVRLKGFSGENNYKPLGNYVHEISVRNKDSKITNVLSVTNSKGFINQSDQFGRSVASEDSSNYKVVRKGQFAYNPSRVNVGSLDLLREFESGILSPMYVVFESNPKKLLPEFLLYQLKTQWFYGHIPLFVQGSVRDSLSFDGLCSMKFFIPSLEEQTAIASLLQTADHEINLLKTKAEKLREQKKGMMQQLLTGKKRIKL